MDIGDPSDIPATRKRLPSLQELGAFDLITPSPGSPVSAAAVVERPAGPTPTPAPARTDRPATASAWAPLPQASSTSDAVNAPAAAQVSAPAAATAAPPAAAPRPARPTPEQLRAALQRADPATRKKLLRLMAGGQTVDQLAGQPAGDPGQAHRLTMSLHRNRPAPSSPPATATPRSGHAMPPPRPTRPAPLGADEPLLRIDDGTDLLDAAAAPVSAEQRKAALQAQLAAARLQESPPRAEAGTAAHKVLFPAYDPREHGDDVRRPTRRPEAPVEGHFPAPRQPMRACFEHADGRPMSEEETQVETVLQEQRCEQTLEVLARDGVNGLLLSPRDLDAAVQDGVLDEATATLLWKTWSALRPVIHVIDDDAPAPRSDDAPEAAGTPDEWPTTVADARPPSAPSSDPLPWQPSPSQAIGPEGDRLPPATPTDPGTIAAPGVPAAPLSVPDRSDETDPPPLPERPPAIEPAVEASAPCAPVAKAPAPAPLRIDIPSSETHGHRSALLGRLLLRGFLAVCVLHTSARVGAWAWLNWGHWLAG